ncbi:hypothetical protein TWF281_010850 [Arthrobotrys megalospora]
MKDKVSEARKKLAEGTKIWFTGDSRFPIGSCAETFPLAVLLTSTGGGTVFSSSIKSNNGDGIHACKRCTATLRNAKTILGLTILDIALPGWEWIKEKEEENHVSEQGVLEESRGAERDEAVKT